MHYAQFFQELYRVLALSVSLMPHATLMGFLQVYFFFFASFKIWGLIHLLMMIRVGSEQ